MIIFCDYRLKNLGGASALFKSLQGCVADEDHVFQLVAYLHQN